MRPKKIPSSISCFSFYCCCLLLLEGVHKFFFVLAIYPFMMSSYLAWLVEIVIFDSVVVVALKYLNHVILQMRDDWYLVCAKKCASSGSKWGAWNWPKSMPRRRRLLEQNYVMHFCAKWFLLQQAADIVRFSTPFEFFACNANRYLMTTSKFLTELWKFPYSIIRKIKNPFGFLILSYSYVDKWYFFISKD